MPPKGKKGSKKGGKSAGADKQNIAQEKAELKEKLLQDELDKVNYELATVQQNVEKLKREHDFLQEEAKKLRVESQEYMSFIEKRTNKRKEAIVTLSDYNRRQIENIEKQKQEMLVEYKNRKEHLREVLMQKQNLLVQTKEQLDDLEPYRKLQKKQLEEIRNLEKELQRVRREHTKSLQELKEDFRMKKTQVQTESDAIVKETTKRANREATEFLNRHTDEIKQDNAHLRRELLRLIKQSDVLEKHKIKLQEQYEDLVREKEYATDLSNIRLTRLEKMSELGGKLTSISPDPMPTSSATGANHAATSQPRLESA